jgi:hypothetical protein
MRPKLRYRRGYANRGRRRQPRIDVGASLHRIVDRIEAALRLRGIGFEESGGTLAVTKKHADYGMRHLSLQRLVKVIEHTIDFGSFTWDRVRGRHQLRVSRENNVACGQLSAVH